MRIFAAVRIFMVSINNQMEGAATTLKGACGMSGINYSTASRGRRKFIRKDSFIEIKEVNLIKVKGRENNHLRKNK